jgi:hypothetical protein
MARTKAKKKTTKRKLILLVGWLALAFAGGYFYGRKTSIKWNDENTAFTYICHASRRIDTPAGTRLVMQMPKAIYVFDGQHVRSDPNWEEISKEKLPVVGGEEYQRWFDDLAEAVAAAGAKVVAEETLGSRVVDTLEGMSKREWIIVTAVSAGSFAGGYSLGHTFKEDFDAPKFRSALDDDKTWIKVWQYKQSLLEAKAKVDSASADLAVLKADPPVDAQEKKKLDDLEKNVNKQYQLLCRFEPQLRNYTTAHN